MPQTVVRAFNTLAQAARSHITATDRHILAGQVIHILSGTTYRQIVIPLVSVGTSFSKLILSSGTSHIEKPYWASPNASSWHQYHTLTDRSSRMLSNMIFYEKQTQKYVRKRDKDTPLTNLYTAWTISPAFVEALMGYCIGYTQI